MSTNPVIKLIVKNGEYLIREELFDCTRFENFVIEISNDLQRGIETADVLTKTVFDSLGSETKSAELLEKAASVIAELGYYHHEYFILSGRIYATHLHRSVENRFSVWMATVGERTLPARITDEYMLILAAILGIPLVFDDGIADFVQRNADIIDSMLDHTRDMDATYTSMIQAGGRVMELPQHTYMRAALAIHRDDLSKIQQTYEALSRQHYIHPPQFFRNAATSRPIYPTTFVYEPSDFMFSLADTADDLDDIWCLDAHIMPVLLHKRGPSPQRTSQYGMPTRQRVDDDNRLTHIAPALWIPDILIAGSMERVDSHGSWSLFDPADVPGLQSTYGAQFSSMYEVYESTGCETSIVQAQDLWRLICEAQTESGFPFCVFHCALNQKNNQAHLGVVRASNESASLVQVSSPTETPAAIPASIALHHFVLPDGTYDFASLHELTKLVVLNCDRLIDRVTYPSETSALAVIRTRSLAVSTHGLGETFMALRHRYGDPNSRILNVDIFDTIYHAALDASCALAQAHGPYPLWEGSAASRGVLHIDMWPAFPELRFDFDALRIRIAHYGLRNSVITAQLPGTSFAQPTARWGGAGPQYRKYGRLWFAICETSACGMQRLERSVQHIVGIPAEVLEIYQTAEEINLVTALDMAADRAPYVEQAEALEVDIHASTIRTLLTQYVLQARAWDSGMKSGVYQIPN
ncbi:hypothetical protein C8Q76DRAFT_694497 [Earliella scabrosa]|nr:hypothetical protein C8Q76DRAFT_694497 [Earliella scabrosa]